MSMPVCTVSSSAPVLQAHLQTLGFFFHFSIINDNHNRLLTAHLLNQDRDSECRAKGTSQGTFVATQFLLTLDIGGSIRIENTSLKFKKRNARVKDHLLFI